MSIFVLMSQCVVAQTVVEEALKIGKTLSLIDNYYVDTTDIPAMTEKVLLYLLQNLDPHSTYIDAEEVKSMNEDLQGNFEGVGIQFNILHDTVVIVELVGGSPSEKAGIKAGDRIIFIDSVMVAGTGIKTAEVRSCLMGPKGTTVNVDIMRPGVKNMLSFALIRDKIPINSLDAAYMLDDKTGYFKFNKFSATTEDEFERAIEKLENQGLEHVIIDLRGNGGGIMSAATNMASNFFDEKKLLVSIGGRKVEQQDFTSSGNGRLSSARLLVLVDESSASASEIFTGAVQDWDRGVVVGRRTFGKGLVQNHFYLNDSSMIRLTIARYYTPTGRLIQSPYNNGYDAYLNDLKERFTGGELFSGNKVNFPDSLKFKTLINKRDVYGGGGIMPDVFVGVDTSYNTMYYRFLVRLGIVSAFALEYSDAHRNTILAQYPDFLQFKKKFKFTDKDIEDFIELGRQNSILYQEKQFKTSKKELLLLLKGLVANSIWGMNEYFMIVNESDKALQRAMNIISSKKEYDKILGYR